MEVCLYKGGGVVVWRQQCRARKRWWISPSSPLPPSYGQRDNEQPRIGSGNKQGRGSVWGKGGSSEVLDKEWGSHRVTWEGLVDLLIMGGWKVDLGWTENWTGGRTEERTNDQRSLHFGPWQRMTVSDRHGWINWPQDAAWIYAIKWLFRLAEALGPGGVWDRMTSGVCVPVICL